MLAKQLKKKVSFRWTIIGRDSDKIYNYKFVRDNKHLFECIPQIDNNKESYFPNSKLIKYYKRANIYVHLSRIESFGISIIEAMSANLPLIAINAKGSNELIKNNVNGIFFNLKKNNFLKKID